MKWKKKKSIGRLKIIERKIAILNTVAPDPRRIFKGLNTALSALYPGEYKNKMVLLGATECIPDSTLGNSAAPR